MRTIPSVLLAVLALLLGVPQASAQIPTASKGSGVADVGQRVQSYGDASVTMALGFYFYHTSAALTAPRVWTLPSSAAQRNGIVIISDAIARGVNSTNTLTVCASGTDQIDGQGAGSCAPPFAAAGAVLALQNNGAGKWGTLYFTAGSGVTYVGCSLSAFNAAINATMASGVYQLAGRAASHCTYSPVALTHLPSGSGPITIQGAGPNGAYTIIDGGQGASGGANFKLFDGDADSASGVTLQAVTVQNFGGSKTCGGTGCGATCGAPSSENWCSGLQTGPSWTVTNNTIQLSGGIGIQIVDGGNTFTHNICQTNSHSCFAVQPRHALDTGLPDSIVGNLITGNNVRGDDPTNDVANAGKVIDNGSGLTHSVYVNYNYVYGAANPANAIWFDTTSAPMVANHNTIGAAINDANLVQGIRCELAPACSMSDNVVQSGQQAIYGVDVGYFVAYNNNLTPYNALFSSGGHSVSSQCIQLATDHRVVQVTTPQVEGNTCTRYQKSQGFGDGIEGFFDQAVTGDGVAVVTQANSTSATITDSGGIMTLVNGGTITGTFKKGFYVCPGTSGNCSTWSSTNYARLVSQATGSNTFVVNNDAGDFNATLVAANLRMGWINAASESWGNALGNRYYFAYGGAAASDANFAQGADMNANFALATHIQHTYGQELLSTIATGSAGTVNGCRQLGCDLVYQNGIWGPAP